MRFEALAIGTTFHFLHVVFKKVGPSTATTGKARAQFKPNTVVELAS